MSKKSYDEQINGMQIAIKDYMLYIRALVINGKMWCLLDEDTKKTVKTLDKTFQSFNKVMGHFDNICYYLSKYKNFDFRGEKAE